MRWLPALADLLFAEQAQLPTVFRKPQKQAMRRRPEEAVYAGQSGGRGSCDLDVTVWHQAEENLKNGPQLPPYIQCSIRGGAL